MKIKLMILGIDNEYVFFFLVIYTHKEKNIYYDIILHINLDLRI